MGHNRLATIIGITVRDFLRERRAAVAGDRRIYAAVRWLCRAQDAHADGGLSAGYDLLRNEWLPSYPEVTGYSIPTFIEYCRFSGDHTMRDRALRMAEWECAVQLECGAVMSGHVGTEIRVPAVFDTGQVIFGWVKAYEETAKEAFIRAAERAADWLCDVQDTDGAWRKYPALQVKNKLNTYNTQVAWALTRIYPLVKKDRYIEAALKNVTWALTQQNEAGWFGHNDFDHDDKPLTHTIAYAAEGIAETGIALGKREFVDSAARCCDALLQRIRHDGSLIGRYDRLWRPAASWSCLAGNAQIAVLLLKLFRQTNNAAYRASAQRINAFLGNVQEVSDNPGIDGGIAGSHPVYGRYEPYKYVSWAAKYVVDALLLEKATDNA